MCNEGYQEAKHSDEHPKLDLRQRVNSNHLSTVSMLTQGLEVIFLASLKHTFTASLKLTSVLILVARPEILTKH